MALKGLSKFVVCGGYAYDTASNKATYTGEAAATEKLVSYSAEIERSDNNDLYGDNGVAETDGGRFVSGTLTVGTTELTNDTSKELLTLKEVKLTVDEKEITGLAYEKDAEGKVVGVGLIEEHQHKNVTFYRSVILPRVKFSIPSMEAETRGSSISWKTPEISGTIMCLEETATDPKAVGERWCETYDCETEAQALAAIKKWFDDRKSTTA